MRTTTPNLKTRFRQGGDETDRKQRGWARFVLPTTALVSALDLGGPCELCHMTSGKLVKEGAAFFGGGGGEGNED